MDTTLSLALVQFRFRLRARPCTTLYKRAAGLVGFGLSHLRVSTNGMTDRGSHPQSGRRTEVTAM